jgi:hypothetical protein
MKGKYKLISLFIILVFAIFPLINIFGQSQDFVNSGFVQDILDTVAEFDNNNYEIEIVSLSTPESNKSFYNAAAVYKLQTEIVIDDTEFLGDGMYFTGLFIDSDGVFDLGEMFVTEERPNGYTPMIYPDPDMNDTYQTFYGTTTGEQIFIGILSDEIPYFGNIYNNEFGENPRARDRYIENIANQLEDVDANVFILEYNVDPDELD